MNSRKMAVGMNRRGDVVGSACEVALGLGLAVFGDAEVGLHHRRTSTIELQHLEFSQDHHRSEFLTYQQFYE